MVFAIVGTPGTYFCRPDPPVGSQGMILAGGSGEQVAFLTPERPLPAGAKLP